MTNRILTAALVGLGVATSVSAVPVAAAEVNVYTYREQPLIQPLFDRFTKATGIRVNVVYANKGLEERIKAEAAASPADLLIATDVTVLDKARQMGITQPFAPATVAAVPAAFRDPDGQWVGLTYRARVIYASKDRVKDAALGYADLADPKFKGRFCVRSGQHPYNVALIASMISHVGEEKAEAWLRGLKANLNAKPSGNDRSQMKSIFIGECDIALGNTYYYGLMATNDKEPEQKNWAGAVKVIMPDLPGGGTHVNISGAVLAKHSPNKAAAEQLIAFMVGEEAQKTYAELNFEYPVRAGVEATPLIRDLGALKPDPTSLAAIAKFRAKASELVDKVAFDDGPGS